MKIFRKIPIYLWVLPTTAPGLLLAAATLLTGGRAKIVQGVLEISGGASDFYLRRIVGIFLRGGASAMTLGHVVAARDAQLLDFTRQHERVHVRQCQRWGPLFIPAYLTASLIAVLCGRRAYKDNAFEIAAYSTSSTGILPVSSK